MGSAAQRKDFPRHRAKVSVLVNPVSYLETGVLYCDDNERRLPEFPDECVDLIYLDPPFFSNRHYEVIWGDEAEVRSFEDCWEGGMEHYIDWMRQRVIQLRRVLAPTGSLYLHCDPHASHYLKVMLDGVLGGENFRNEIVWKRTGAHGAAKRYAPIHDLILYYGASRAVTWNATFHEYSAEYLGSKYSYHDERGRYRLITLFPPGVRNGATGQPWRGIDPTVKGMHWRHPPSRLDELDTEGMIYWGVRGRGLPQLKRYLDESEGVAVQDVWTDLSPINSQARERLGYPTQKPEALLERIIAASSNEGDIVFDPFCGCGTTVTVAEKMRRRWVGIDISPTAVNIMRRRLIKATNTACNPAIIGLPETQEELRALKPFEFQNWVIQKMYGTHSVRKSWDMGIDGYSYLVGDPIQIKQSDRIGRNVVDNFETAIRRAGKSTGYLVGFSFTRGAREEVARGRWHDKIDIQIIEVLELLHPSTEQATVRYPTPASVIDMPLGPVRGRDAKPTADELIASDQQRAG